MGKEMKDCQCKKCICMECMKQSECKRCADCKDDKQMVHGGYHAFCIDQIKIEQGDLNYGLERVL